MVRLVRTRFIVLAPGALLLATFGWGQATPTSGGPEKKGCVDGRPAADAKARADGSCAPASAPAKVGAGQDGASAAQRFPYPGENSGESPEAGATVTAPDAPDAVKPQAGGARSDGKPAGDAFPYPGESRADAGASSSSGSSSSSSSSAPDSSAAGAPGLDDVGSESSTRAARRRLPKPERIQSDEDRATEDMTVAKFYQQSGNLQAAYLRAKDAVKMQPADAETHFVLAGVLEKMRRREEAVAEFEAYLKLDPDGEHVKAARKAIAAGK